MVTNERVTKSDLDTEAVYEEVNQIPRHVQQVLSKDSNVMVSLDECPAYGVSAT